MDKQKEFFKLISRNWIAADWEQTSPDDLRCHISEWISQGGDLSDMFLAVFEFEEYMGW